MRPPPRHATASLLTPNRWVMPTSALTFLALVNLLAWATVAGGPGGKAHADPPASPHAHARHLPAVGPAPLAALTTTSRTGAATLVGGAVRHGVHRKAATVRHGASPTATTLRPSVSLSPVNDVAAASALAQDGIPVTALLAYKQAAAREHRLNASCGLTWPLLAAIGRVESDHGRFAGAVLHADGRSTPAIIGIPLNGHGTALIGATAYGLRLDGDPLYDHAVGPMQFIPSTWAAWGVDANHDGVADPFNIFDAAAAAADYLCAAGGNLMTYAGQVQAVHSYNDSNAYVALVLDVERAYAAGVGVVVPVAPGTGVSGPGPHTTLPPVNPGKPPGLGKGKDHPHGSHPSRSPSSSAARSPSACPSDPDSASPSHSSSRSPSDEDSQARSPKHPHSRSTPQASSPSPSACPSQSESASPSRTKSASPSASKSASPSRTKSASPSASKSASPSRTKSASPSRTRSASPSRTKSASASRTKSASPSRTKSASASPSRTKSASASPSRTKSASASRTKSASKSGSASRSSAESGGVSPSGSPPTSAAPLLAN